MVTEVVVQDLERGRSLVEALLRDGLRLVRVVCVCKARTEGFEIAG